MANTLRFKRGLASGIPTALAGEPLFTTDTFDLYIGNGTTNTRFQKYIASGATTQILRGDGSLYTFPLAISSPSAGQVLKYNGTSWVNDSDSGITGSLTTNYLPKATGATTLGNSQIFDNGTNVGIGTTSPAGKLEVNGLTFINNTGDTTARLLLRNTTTGGSAGGLDIREIGVDTSINNASNGNMYFSTNNTERVRFFAAGNVGIGTGASDSGEKLQVTGTMNVTGASYLATSSGSVGIGTSTPDASFKLTISGNSGANTPGIYFNDEASSPVNYTLYTNGNKNFVLRNQSSAFNIATFTPSGNLGLGVTPSAWSTSYKAIQVSSITSLFGGSTASFLGTNYYIDTSNVERYIGNGFANVYRQFNGTASWFIAPNNTSGAGAAMTLTQAMTLDASGNLLLNNASTSVGNANALVAYGGADSGIIYLYRTTGTDQLRFYVGGNRLGYINTESSTVRLGTANYPLAFDTNDTERMRITSGGNLLVGTTTDAGYKLDVNGTGRFVSSNNTTPLTISAGSNATFEFKGNSTSGYTASFNINDTGLYISHNSAYRDLVLQTNSVDRLTISGSGAATFSSSVTAGGNLLLTAGTAASIGAINLIRTGTSPVASRMTFGTDGTGYSFAIAKNQASTITDLVTISDSGAANFSASIQAATAIAIGTTPDTNNPFKILKNINATVGIKFENTNTSSLAFSAVQVGTDITGGTAFTNLVYGSSGISEAGVFKPNGTALINTGSGGLNFLAVSQPIRFFTSTGNGTLRISITNDGDFTQFNGTNPSASTTDAFRMYSADVTAGNAAPHFRTENGAVIKLYQETTAVGNSTISVGGGNAVLDDTEFGGYTLRQVVKALQNQGILA